MPNNPKFPHFNYFEVEFTKDGSIANRNQVAAVNQFLSNRPNASDIFVMSHGWINDIDEARRLYLDFFGHVRNVLDSGAFNELSDRKFVVIAILWPSIKFADEDVIPGERSREPIVARGGAAAMPYRKASARINAAADAAVHRQLDKLRAALGDPSAAANLDNAEALVRDLEGNPPAQKQFVDIVRSVLRKSPEGVTGGDASTAFFKLDGLELLRRLLAPLQTVTMTPQPKKTTAAAQSPSAQRRSVSSTKGPRASVASLGDFLGGIKGAVAHLLNYTTYYVMKERAGTVGRTGVNAVLKQIRDNHPQLKLHLVGHSFGGRLVTAAADGPASQPPVRPSTMTLLQAAFSHNGFALHFDGVHDGFFRSVVTGRKISGPILITCSSQDRAVGIAYPIASRLSGVMAAALGDRNDPFGGIGRNGAQKTPEAVDGDLLARGRDYKLAGGKLYNLNADKLITGHSDICRDDISTVLLTAVSVT
jgi:hypothetical protein